MYAEAGGVVEAEPPPLAFPFPLPNASPAFEATEEIDSFKFSNIWALIWPLFGGREGFCFFRGADGAVAINRTRDVLKTKGWTTTESNQENQLDRKSKRFQQLQIERTER